ncbi:putative F-box domain-containing protein [Helianthus annuus]|nr:putative F-box domain-containing protein [Helianthus annuus]
MSEYIPFALQAEMMKRLPTKSLLQFRTVSKQWKSLIDSSQFVVDYSIQQTHQHLLLVCYLDAEKFEMKYDSVVEDEGFPEHKCSLLEIKYDSIVEDEGFPEHKCSLPGPIARMPTIRGSSAYTLYKEIQFSPEDSQRLLFFGILQLENRLLLMCLMWKIGPLMLLVLGFVRTLMILSLSSYGKPNLDVDASNAITFNPWD